MVIPAVVLIHSDRACYNLIWENGQLRWAIISAITSDVIGCGPFWFLKSDMIDQANHNKYALERLTQILSFDTRLGWLIYHTDYEVRYFDYWICSKLFSTWWQIWFLSKILMISSGLVFLVTAINTYMLMVSSHFLLRMSFLPTCFSCFLCPICRWTHLIITSEVCMGLISTT